MSALSWEDVTTCSTPALMRLTPSDAAEAARSLPARREALRRCIEGAASHGATSELDLQGMRRLGTALALESGVVAEALRGLSLPAHRPNGRSRLTILVWSAIAAGFVVMIAAWVAIFAGVGRPSASPAGPGLKGATVGPVATATPAFTPTSPQPTQPAATSTASATATVIAGTAARPASLSLSVASPARAGTYIFATAAGAPGGASCTASFVAAGDVPVEFAGNAPVEARAGQQVNFGLLLPQTTPRGEGQLTVICGDTSASAQVVVQ